MTETTDVRRSFWRTLPGVVTGTLGVLASLTAIIAFLAPGSSGTPAWVSAANDVCKAEFALVSHPIGQGGANTNDAELEQQLGEYATVIHAIDERLRTVSVPAEHQSTFTAMINTWESGRMEAEKAKSDFEAGATSQTEAQTAAAAGDTQGVSEKASAAQSDFTNATTASANVKKYHAEGAANAKELGLGNCSAGIL